MNPEENMVNSRDMRSTLPHVTSEISSSSNPVNDGGGNLSEVIGNRWAQQPVNVVNNNIISNNCNHQINAALVKELLEHCFRKDVNDQQEKIKKLDRKCRLLILQCRHVETASKESETKLRDELGEERNQRQQSESAFTTSVENFIEEFVQLTLRISQFEENIKDSDRKRTTEEENNKKNFNHISSEANKFLERIHALEKGQMTLKQEVKVLKEEVECLKTRLNNVPSHPPQSENVTSDKGTNIIVSTSSASYDSGSIETPSAIKTILKKKVHFARVQTKWKMQHGINTAIKSDATCLCGATFKRSKYLTAHIRYYTGGNKFSCKRCLKQFQLKSALKKHILLFHTQQPKRQIAIASCSSSSSSSVAVAVRHEKDLTRHFFCLCGNNFENSQRLSRHIRYHKSKKISSEICSRVFRLSSNLSKLSNQAKLDSAMLKQNTQSKSQSPSEKKGSKFRQFKKKQRNIGIIKVVDKSATATDLVVVPVKRARIRNQCSHCGRSFSTLSLMLEHWENDHNSGQRSSKNQIHGFKYEVQDEDGIQFHCKCGKRFNKKSRLIQHIRGGNNSRNVFKCKICSKDFRYLTHLKSHVTDVHKTVFNDGNNGCTNCGQIFKTKKELSLHCSIYHKNQ